MNDDYLFYRLSSFQFSFISNCIVNSKQKRTHCHCSLSHVTTVYDGTHVNLHTTVLLQSCVVRVRIIRACTLYAIRISRNRKETRTTYLDKRKCSYIHHIHSLTPPMPLNLMKSGWQTSNMYVS